MIDCSKLTPSEFAAEEAKLLRASPARTPQERGEREPMPDATFQEIEASIAAGEAARAKKLQDDRIAQIYAPTSADLYRERAAAQNKAQDKKMETEIWNRARKAGFRGSWNGDIPEVKNCSADPFGKPPPEWQIRQAVEAILRHGREEKT